MSGFSTGGAPRVIDVPSPNRDSREGVPVDILLFHYTGMETAAGALQRLCDAKAKVSAHYMIDEHGTLFRMVPEDMRAWHAGVSSWAGATNINHRSIGIEMVNPGHEWGYRPFPEAQIAVAEQLAKEILSRHHIPPARVLGHSDVAPDRKEDPGELFPWERLAASGIGLRPVPGPSEIAPSAPGDEGPAVTALQQELAAFGYGLPCSGCYETATQHVVAAFQRHFRPSRVDGVADDETLSVLAGCRAAVQS